MPASEAQVRDMGEAALRSHGLAAQGWTLAFDNARTRAGCCNYTRRVISVSRRLLPVWSLDMVRNTLLHEVAHALAGHEHGHDHVWRAVALSVGCDGKRCHYAPFSEPLWHITCPCGKLVMKRHKLSVRYTSTHTCKHCKGALLATRTRA